MAPNAAKPKSSKPSKRAYSNVPGTTTTTDDTDPLSASSGNDEIIDNDLSASSNNNNDCEHNAAAAVVERRPQMSVDDAIDRLGMGKFQYRILVASGLCFAADAMEVLLLSFLSIVLQEEWGLTDDETAFITSMLFAGALVGTSFLGPLADRWGRRPVFTLSASIIALFGASTALARNYEQVLGIMFLVGFGIGGLTVPFDTLAEFLPSQNRGRNLLLIEYFWTFGCLLVIVFAELTLTRGNENWRYFVALCALPCFSSIILGLLFVPESVRWLVSEGRNDEAIEVLRYAARINKLEATTPFLQQPQGENSQNNNDTTNNSHQEEQDHDDDDDDDDLLGHDAADIIFPLNTIITSDEDHSEEASCLDLLKPQWRGTMLRLWGAWAGFTFGYFGSILSITKVFDNEGVSRPDPEQGMMDFSSNATDSFLSMMANATTSSMEDVTISASNITIPMEDFTTKQTEFDYSGIFISSSAELVGTTIVILLVDRAGRIPSQLLCYTLAGVCIFLLTFLASMSSNSEDRMELIALGFILRALEMGGTAISWVATAELLTTEIRASGHASANAMARLGAFFSPFVVDDMSLRTIGITMMLVHFFTAGCIAKLPETKGVQMGGGAGGHSHDHHGPEPDEDADGLFLSGDDNDEYAENDAVAGGADISAVSEEHRVSERSNNMELT